MSKQEKSHTVSADNAVREGRLADDKEVSDAAVTLYVHAGIAAADAICAAAVGKHAQGSDHRQAISLLATVDKEASNWLRTLLGMKIRAGYEYNPTSGMDLRRAERAARSLVSKAGL